MKTRFAVLSIRKQKKTKLFGFYPLLIKLSAGFFLCYCNHSNALSWKAIPSLQTQEIYSDNISLAPAGSEKGAFVTDVSPGVSVSGQSAQSMLNINYRMQNLYNAGGNKSLNTNNQLQFNGNTILIPNKFFLSSTSSISQQNINNNQIANDNISGSGNSTTVSTFSLSPTWTPRFGHYANGNFQANFNTVATNNNLSGATAPLATISDSMSVAEIMQLNSGSEFKRINWNLSLNNTDNYRSGGNNVKFQNSSATIRGLINNYFNIFVQGGYSNNHFQSGINNQPTNGLIYTTGVQWKPSAHYSIEAGYGNNSHVTVNISPLQRVSWITTVRDNAKGLNSGQTWQTALNYQTRRSIWSLTHENDTTTTQALLAEIQVFTVVDPFGNPIIDPITHQPIQRAIFLNTLTDEVISRKKWNFSVFFNAGRSTLGATAFDEDRAFQTTGDHQQVKGLSANWAVNFNPQTSVYISPRWQQTDRAKTLTSGIAGKDNRYDVAIGLTQSLTSQLNGRLELRHLNQDSDLKANSYQENRVTANLFMRF